MRVKLGPIVTDARGTLDDVVFSIWKAGVHYVRSLAVDPGNPESEMQQIMRDAKAAALAAWTALAADVKALWEEYAQSFGRRNQDLDAGGGTANLVPHHRPPLTGQNAFIQAWLRRARAFLGSFNNPPTGIQPCLVDDLAIAWDAVDNELDVTWTDPGVCAGSETNYFAEDFEDEDIADTPDMWDPVWGYTQTGTRIIRVSNNFAHSPTKSAQVAPGTGTNKAWYNMALLATLDGIVVEHWFLCTSATGIQKFLGVSGTDGVNGIIVTRCTGGNAQTNDGGVYQSIGAHGLNVWNHVRYVIYPTTRTYDVYFNDMCCPAGIGFVYFTDQDAGALRINNVGSFSTYIDDINVFSSSSLLRLWLVSYQAPTHKQLFAHQHVFLEEAHPTRARYAAGALDNIDNHHGLYYIQGDVLATDEERNGLLSVPSKIFRIDVN